MMTPDRELDKFLDKSSEMFARALFNLIKAKFGQANRETALADLAGLIQRTMILADLHGRRRLFMEMDHAINTQGKFASSTGTPLVPSVPFVEAVEDLLFREPRLAKSAEEVSRLYSTEHVFAMARASEGLVDERIAKWRTEWVQRRMAEGIEEGKGLYEMTEAMREIGPWTEAYAQTVYRTNVSNSYTQGRFEQAKDPEVADIMPAMELVGVPDAQERPNHRAARGLIAATTDAVWNKLKPPLGYQCFLPGTCIEGRILSASKTIYSGPAVEIKTRSGARLSVTINHPILTEHGWATAGSLKKGHNLYGDLSKIESLNKRASGDPAKRRTVHDQDMPSLIEDIFESLWAKRTTVTGARFPMLALDLHGDARWCNGYIDIVLADGEFLQDASQRAPQSVGKFPFEFATNATSSRDGGSAGDSCRKGFSLSPRGTPSVSALALDDGGIIASAFSENPFHPLCVGPSSSWDAFASEKAKNSGVVDFEFISQLACASSGVVLLDEIISVRRFPFTGHVYNLQTEGSWILSNNVITSNCRHGVRMVSRFELERKGLIDKNGNVTRYEPPNFHLAEPDPGFR